MAIMTVMFVGGPWDGHRVPFPGQPNPLYKVAVMDEPPQTIREPLREFVKIKHAAYELTKLRSEQFVYDFRGFDQ